MSWHCQNASGTVTEKNHIIPPDYSATDANLSGCNIVITGAATEIGNTVAYAAAKAGATTLLLSRKHRDVSGLYDQIIQSGYAEPMIIEFDMLKASPADFSTLADSLSAEFPQLHGLAHCAIWGAPLTPVQHADLEHWQKILDQQLCRPMYLTRVLASMINGDHAASVVFTVMDVGRTGRAYWGAVGAAFAGIENLNETLSSEWANNNTRVNSIDCGRTKTAIRKTFYPGESGEDLRPPDAAEIADAYIYLLSDQSDLSGCRVTIPD